MNRDKKLEPAILGAAFFVFVSLVPIALVSMGGAVAAEASDLSADSSTFESYRRALDVVERGLSALGGTARLEGAGGITLVGNGTLDLSTRMQGMRPDRPDPVPIEKRLAVDLRGHRLAYETHGRVNPDADEWIRFLFDAEGRQLVVLRLGGQAFWVPGDEDHRRRYERIVPHLLLEDALDRRETLRHLGRHGDEEVVSVTLATGDPMSLLFDTESGLLVGFEYLLDLPLLGDTPIRWRFDEHRQVDGLGPYPTGYRIHVGDRLFERIRYELVRPGVGGAAVFEEPEGIAFPDPQPTGDADESVETPPTPDRSDLPEVRTLADGVYLAVGVRSGFHVLFAELEDSVLVVDTPAGYHELQMVPAIDWAGDVTSSSVGRRLLAAIRATVPAKPVRHVVLTHHHGDHAGGVRPFLAAGVTVYASAVTKPVVERAAAATFTLAPDELTGGEIEPRIVVVDGELTISDAERTVRIFDVGPNPHVEGMLVVFFPDDGILYQSDLFMPAAGSFPDPARIPVMRWFVDWLDRSGLEPERIYAIHGSAKVTDDQLETIRGLE